MTEDSLPGAYRVDQGAILGGGDYVFGHVSSKPWSRFLFVLAKPWVMDTFCKKDLQ